MKKIGTFLTILLALFFYAAQAQEMDQQREDSLLLERHKRMRERIDSKLSTRQLKKLVHVDSLLTKRHKKVWTDTTYITRPPYDWIAKVRLDGFGRVIHIDNVHAEDEIMNLKLKTDLRTSITLMAYYKGLGVKLSISPSKLFKKDSDQEYNINYYNNWWGVDVSFSNISHFDMTMKLGDGKTHYDWQSARLFGASINGYYVFNARKFSYPAAFNNTWIQRRSAGSFIAAASFYHGSLSNTLEEPKWNMLEDQKVKMTHVSLGGGYAYNFVIPRHWLLHLSVEPTFIIWKNYTLRIQKDAETGQPITERLPMQKLQFYAIGRLGAIYSRHRHFYGIMAVLQSYKVGESEKFTITNNAWKVRAYLGVRF